MDINKIIKTLRNLNEGVPTNSTGSSISTYDKFLFPIDDDDLSQDYQTPGQSGLAKWRFSNVWPVEKVTEIDVDKMVDASQEYMNLSTQNTDDNLMDSRLKNLINIVRGLKEEMMTTGSSGGVAGFSSKAPAKGPTAGYDTLIGKKKRPTILAKGKMPGARKRWSGKDES